MQCDIFPLIRDIFFQGSQLILFIVFELLIKTTITTTALCDNYFGNYKTSPSHLAYIYKLKIGLSMSADQNASFPMD